ncbi:MAG: hypothetical protein AAFO07_25605 [Bacteroidota bacterium]
MEGLVESLGGLIIVGGFVLIVYFIARYTYLIKKMLAEKGMLNKNPQTRLTKLDIAYVTVGIGVGLLISAGLSLLPIQGDTMDLLSWGIVLISGAMGLILASNQKKEPFE